MSVYPENLKQCFTFDESKYNTVPKKWIGKIIKVYLNQRYSMFVYLRLTEYFYSKFMKKKNKLYLFMALFFKRRNEINNHFEHGLEHDISRGILLHHGGVTFPAKTILSEGVEIFKNVTLAMVQSKVCSIGKNTILFSHVIVLGCDIGENCVIGAGSVVLDNIPDNSVVAGVPAKVIGVCKNSKDYVEFK